MRDPQRIVDEIRAFLMASDQILNDRLQELAREYREACAEVNARLARCAQLIKQGLRAEAIHLAEADPNLLTALQVLDFPDRAAWLDVVGLYELDSPPDLEHKISEHLGAAYTDQDPLQNLLRKHRRLALARAPLCDRLVVLRQLARADSTNPIWIEDCRAYETARFKQIQLEAAEVARRGDVAATEALERELLDGVWSTRPPKTLTQGIRKAAEALRQKAAWRELPAFETELNDAFSALDVPRARAARANWITQAEAARLPGDHPLRDRIEPALLWVDKQDLRDQQRNAYSRAEIQLDQALDDPTAPADHLERLFAALLRAEQDLIDPPGRDVLTSRYRARVSGLEQAVTRRRRLMVGALAAAMVAAGITAVWLFRSFERSAAERQAVESLDKALASESLEEIDALLALFEKTHPEILGSVGVLARMPAVDEAREAESARVRGLEAHKADAENAALTGQEPPALELARSLVRSDEERQGVEAIAKRIDRKNRELALQVDAELGPELDAVANELDGIEAEASRTVHRALDAPVLDLTVEARPRSELLRRITQASQRLETALPNSGPISEVARARSTRLRERLRLVTSELNLIERDHQSSEMLTAAIRRLPAEPAFYASAVAARAAVFQGTPQQGDLQKVLGEQERPVWESALKWSAYAAKWAKETTPLAPDAAQARIEFCQGFLKENPACPDARVVREYVSYLEPIVRRASGDDSLRDRLTKSLSSPSIDPVYMVSYKQPSSGDAATHRYYSSTQVPRRGTISAHDFRVRSDGSTRSFTLVDRWITKRDLSPQSKLAKEVKANLEDGSLLVEWDLGLTSIAEKTANDFEMDPICKLLILRVILDVAAEGSQALRESLGPTLNALNKADHFRSVHWLDPEADIDAERNDARELLAKLPDWSAVAASAADADARLRRSAALTPRPIGWLSRRQAVWSIHFGEPGALTEVKNGARLVVAMPAGEGGVWVPLGALTDRSETTVVLDRPELGAEGRLVFLDSRITPDLDVEERSTGR